MTRRDPAFPSGRFRPGAGGARAVLLLGAAAALGLWSGGCAPIGFQAEAPTPETPPIPSVEAVDVPASSAREAARLLGEARAHLSAGAYQEARSAALEVIRHHSGAPGSGEALGIQARAALGLGLTREAVEAAGRYSGLLGSSHPLFPPSILLWGQALADAGDTNGATEVLLRLPPGTSSEVAETARDLFRETIGGMDAGDLLEAVTEVSPAHPLRGVLLTELAVALHFGGDAEGALLWAREALAGPLDEREADLIRALREGRLEEALGLPVILGVILPRSGVPPSVVEYGRLLEEGVRVAIQEFQSDLRRSVHLEVADDGGLPGGSMASIQRLEELGALGVIGLLTQELLAGAVQGREKGIPIISPAVAPGMDAIPGVLALSGPDVAGARALARHARSAGMQRITVVRPRTERARVEAAAFRDEIDVPGAMVVREILYDPGATFFRDELSEVARTRPDGLFLPLAPHEIELMAPQFSYFGLDTLGIQILGTSGWTSEDLLSRIDSRHTDGVVASASRIGPEDMEGFERFRAAYERYFQKTLRSHVPAFGYDAAALLLQALQTRPRDTHELVRALDQIREFPGATGRLSVEGGRVTRSPRLVRIESGQLVPIQPLAR